MNKILKIGFPSLMLLATTVTLTSCNPTEKGFVDGKFNLTIAVQAEDGEQEILSALKKAYELKNPNVNIIMKDFAGKTFINLMQDYSNDTSLMPMVLWMDDRDFAGFSKGGYFVDLRSYYEQSVETDYSLYYETMLDSAAYNGKFKPTTQYQGAYAGEKDDNREYGLYFAPRDYNEIAIVYNKTKLNNYGLEIPEEWNWDNFIKLLHDAGKNMIEQGGADEINNKVIYLHSSYEPVWTSIFEEFKSDGIIKDGALNIDSKVNKDIYESLINDLYKYDTEFVYEDEPDTIKNMISTKEDDFYNGRTMFTVCPRPVVFSMYEKLKRLSVDIDFLPFPTKKIAAGCSGYGITRQYEGKTQTVNGVTKKVYDLAWDFIKFAITTEGQEVSGETGVSVPVLKSLKETGKWREALDKNLNHDAFIQPEELHMSTFNCFDCSNKIRSNLRTSITNFFIQLENNSYSSIDDLISKTTNSFNAVLK